MLPQLLEEPAAACIELVPLTVEQYHQMLAAGILEEGAPIELLDGLLVAKDRGPGMTVHPLHSFVVSQLVRRSAAIDKLGCHLRIQSAVTIPPRHEPEPDALIVRGQPRDYLQRHPGPEDVSSAVEVADSSLARDRTTKLRIYATAGIPQYVVINIPDRRLEVYEEPDRERGGYRDRRELAVEATLALLLPDGRRFEVAASDLLP